MRWNVSGAYSLLGADSAAEIRGTGSQVSGDVSVRAEEDTSRERLSAAAQREKLNAEISHRTQRLSITSSFVLPSASLSAELILDFFFFHRRLIVSSSELIPCSRLHHREPQWGHLEFISLLGSQLNRGTNTQPDEPKGIWSDVRTDPADGADATVTAWLLQSHTGLPGTKISVGYKVRLFPWTYEGQYWESDYWSQ